MVLQRVVCQVFDDDCGLLLVDEPGGLGDELLGVEPELGKRLRRDPAEDRCRGPRVSWVFSVTSPRRSYLTWEPADTVSVWVAVSEGLLNVARALVSLQRTVLPGEGRCRLPGRRRPGVAVARQCRPSR